MAIKSFQYTVTTTRIPISNGDTDLTSGVTLYLYNETQGVNKQISIGGADVTFSNGIHIYGGESFYPIEVRQGEVLYAVSNDALGIDLRVMQVGS